MGVAGGKDKEDIDCPWCRKTVDQKMTDGWFVTSKIEQFNMSTGKNTKTITKKKAAPSPSCKPDGGKTRIIQRKGGGSLDPGPNKPK